MRITKRQLRSLVREAMEMTPEEITQSLLDNARSYHQDRGLKGDASAIRTLLQDDFMDDFGHVADVRDYSDVIDQLSMSPNLLELKKRLRRIVQEIKLADLTDSETEYYTDSAGARQLVPGVGWVEAREQQELLAKHVSEYIAYAPPSPTAEKSAIKQVAADERVSVKTFTPYPSFGHQ